MARPRKELSWRPADFLRIKAWFRALLAAALPGNGRRDRNQEFRSADLQRALADGGVEISSSRLTDWKFGRCRPSKVRLQLLRRVSPQIAGCEPILSTYGAITENRLANLLLVLDLVGATTPVRQQCLDLLPKLAADWLPEADIEGNAAFGWRLPKLGNRVVEPNIALGLNTFDPLSLLDCCLRIADSYLVPQSFTNEPGGDIPDRMEVLREEWSFDMLSMSLLINRLIARELSYPEVVRLSASAGAATILRKILFTEMPPLAIRQQSMLLKEEGMPSNYDFVSMLARCAMQIESALAKSGIGVAEVRGVVNSLWRKQDQ